MEGGGANKYDRDIKLLQAAALALEVGWPLFESLDPRSSGCNRSPNKSWTSKSLVLPVAGVCRGAGGEGAREADTRWYPRTGPKEMRAADAGGLAGVGGGRRDKKE